MHRNLKIPIFIYHILHRILSVIILLLLVSSKVTFGQLAISSGLNISNPTIRGFNLLTDSYNRYHKTELSRSLEAFSPGIGWYINGTWYFNEKSTFESSYNQITTKTSAKFTNNGIRHFDLILSFFEIEFGKGIRKEKLEIWGTLGTIWGRVNIDSYYEFADGTFDYGTSKLLNGQYQSLVKGLTISLNPKYHLYENLSVFIKISGYHYFKPKALEDKDGSKLYTEPPSNFLPTDYHHFIEIHEHFGGLPEQYKIKADLRGVKFTFGLQYYFQLKKE